MASTDEMVRSIVLNNLVEILETKEFEKELIDQINDDVDIPMINEKSEKKVFKAIYKVVLKAVRKYAEQVSEEVNDN